MSVAFPKGPISSLAVARLVDGAHHGPEVSVAGVAGLEEAHGGQLSFLQIGGLDPGDAGCLLVRAPLPGRSCVVVPDPLRAFVWVMELMLPEAHPRGVHESAVIQGKLGEGVSVGATAVVGPGAVIGDDAVLYPGVVVGAGCTVGTATVLYANAVLYPGVSVGARCRIQAGCVLGAEGFRHLPTGGVPLRVPQRGRVVIEDDVELGANTCVDRAFLGETRIGRGARIDNLVQVGHNVSVGAGSLIAAQTGLSGSVTLGQGVLVGGQAGVVDHVTVGDGARIGAGSGVIRDVKPGQSVLGSPAMSSGRALRVWALMRKLPEILGR